MWYLGKLDERVVTIMSKSLTSDHISPQCGQLAPIGPILEKLVSVLRKTLTFRLATVIFMLTAVFLILLQALLVIR
jgi:hypothetical protein